MPAAIHDMIHFIGITCRKFQVMLYRDNGNSLLMQLLHKFVQLLLALDINAGRRLIKNQQLWAAQQCSGNQYLLALSAAQRTD